MSHLPRPTVLRAAPCLFPLLLAALAALAASCEPTELPQPVVPPPPPPAAAPLPGLGDPAPTLRLPSGTRPTAEAIELHVDPAGDRFSGAVDIDVTLAAPSARIWLHGRGMTVSEASVTPAGGAPLPAAWKQVDEETGLSSLTLGAAVPAGAARIHVAFDAPFERGHLGLYKVLEDGRPYAFTQFESVFARRAFPCFDEPGFKVPFALTLVVPEGMQVIANTHEAVREQAGPSAAGSSAARGPEQRVRFAPTPPLPSYLVAFAVGPLDIVPAPDVPPNGVRTRPLALRGVTAAGRGKEIAYTLSHTGELVSLLEKYTGLEYPWDKLDILAVPGQGGAMENPGAVTFGESLLLMDPATASISQRRGFAYVTAHELAHQWTGDLVTMQWWDDTWLNEAFATWLGYKTVEAWDPKMHAELAELSGVQGAMGADALVSARAIRQPIASTHDILNAFDSITYRKGGAVLSMFEKWAGAAGWQKGLHDYLVAHRNGNATADDFLDAENAATGKDVKAPFHTFLDQPGLPYIDANVTCAAGAPPTAHLSQSRFLPAGSSGDARRTWQLPVCLRTDRDTECSLLTQPSADVPLKPGPCPAWFFPNSDADGYYRFSMSKDALAKLRDRGLGKLAEREKMALGSSLRGAYSRGTSTYKDVLLALAPLASDPEPNVAEEPMAYLDEAHDWFHGWFAGEPIRAHVETYIRRLYGPVFARLGWTAARTEDDERRSLRAAVLWDLVEHGRDPALRAEAKKRALAYLGLPAGPAAPGKAGAPPSAPPAAPPTATVHPDAVDPNLVGTVLATLGEDADKPTWDAMHSLFSRSVDSTLRSRLLGAMSLAKDPALAAAARDLVLDPGVHDNELGRPLFTQLGRPERREAAWTWLESHFDAIVGRLSAREGAWLITTARAFCDEAHAEDVQAFFGPRAAQLEGGPRTLAATVEDIELCVARRKIQEPSAREMFAKP